MSAAAHGVTVTADIDTTSHWSRALGGLERLIGHGVEACAAFLVASEIVVLFVGVISRYVLHSPCGGR